MAEPEKLVDKKKHLLLGAMAQGREWVSALSVERRRGNSDMVRLIRCVG